MKVELIDFMGNDDSIVNSARVSFNKRADMFSKEENERLINYLAKHKHEIPFAHTAITIRVKAPISIRTQCFKHKIGFVENEVSRRYISDTPEFFTPIFREAPSSNIKQGSGKVIDKISTKGTAWEDLWDTLNQMQLQDGYKYHMEASIEYYESLINAGVSPEQARFVLPQGVMTEWIWTGSLLAFARFYKLRSEKYAQQEIQDLAKMISDIIEKLYPIAWSALCKYPEDT